MARDRVSGQMQTQIKVLMAEGMSIRKVARALGVSRQTVRRYAMEGTKEAEAKPVEGSVKWDSAIDWQKAKEEVGSKGVSVKQLHKELAPEVSYLRFWRELKQHLPPQAEVSLRREHVIGSEVEIDYCDGIVITDHATGKKTKTHLFVGVLPFSSYTFGEFVWNQRLDSFIASHERMWSFFGGVTPYAVVDNLKSAVSRAHRYDPDTNPTYCEYANHTGFCVLPARPYKPRDKACVEATIGAIQRGFFQEARAQIFYTLEELNWAFREYLVRFNQTVMKDHGASRDERFVEEKKHLKALPQSRFELCEWRQAKVHPDCHIQVERNFYSVPYAAVGQSVRVRIGSKVIEIFSGDAEPLAAHPRLIGKGRFSTQEQHYPEQKLGIKRFEVCSAQAQARRIGPHTDKLVESLISADYPLRHLRRIQGILRLSSSEQVSKEALEYAAQKALAFGKPRFAYVKSCAEYFAANGTRLTLARPERHPDSVYLHGDVQGSSDAERSVDADIGGQS